jgi:rieske iron-sulfur protein
MRDHDQELRSLLLTALATGACLATRSVLAEDQPGSDERPRKGDMLVISEGEHEGVVIKPDDLKLGGPPLRAWPKDPKTSVVRNGSRLNEILVLRLDPGELDDATRARAADGILAYSAICAHAACPVSEWVKATEGDKTVLKCPCHNFRVSPSTRCRGRVWACAPTPGCTSPDDYRWRARCGGGFRWKGWCPARTMSGPSSRGGTCTIKERDYGSARPRL